MPPFESSDPSLRLTQTVKKGGCAAKIPAGELRAILASLKLRALPELEVGTETLDDAALWDLGDGRYLIQTLDFFTPIVDAPYDFGAVAAANALSDIYAMGGEPRTALSILAFPTQTLDLALLRPLMKGAVEKIEEAGACLAGGHSIDDDTLKLGFSVAGFVPKARAWTNSGARPGDTLILTKALGTGTIASALKNGKARPEWVESAVRSMTTLNRAPELLGDLHVHAATDITGFGLAGHAVHVARSSSVVLEVSVGSLPALPGAGECLAERILNRAHRTNAEYVVGGAFYGDDVGEELRLITVDAQTSGGLLLSIASEDAPEALGRLKARFPAAVIVGRARALAPGESGGFVRFT